MCTQKVKNISRKTRKVREKGVHSQFGATEIRKFENVLAQFAATLKPRGRKTYN